MRLTKGQKEIVSKELQRFNDYMSLICLEGWRTKKYRSFTRALADAVDDIEKACAELDKCV